MIIEFTLDYLPTLAAAEHELACAEAQYDADGSVYMGGYASDWPRVHLLERYRAARDRLFAARENFKQARHRESQKRASVWA